MVFPEDHDVQPGTLLVAPVEDLEGTEDYLNGLFKEVLGHDEYTVTGPYDLMPAYLVGVPIGDELKAAAEIEALDEVDWAEPLDATADNRVRDLEEIMDEIDGLDDLAYMSGTLYEDGIRFLIEKLQGYLPESS